jgi:hypothetical protein
MYHDDSNEPGEGSTEDLWAQATGTKKKPERKRVWKASADFKPRPKGAKVDRSDPDYQRALMAARKGMPPFHEITFLEAVMFDNGEVRPRGTPRHQIKLGWTCAPPQALDKATRSQRLTVRYIPLAVRAQARDNWNRRGKRQGMFRFEPEDRVVIDEMMSLAKLHDGAKIEGRPAALMGCVQHHFGAEGTIRHPQYGLVTWDREAEDAPWMPRLQIFRSYPEMGLLVTRDATTGEEQPGLRMRPGRGENVLAYGSHYGRDFIHHMRPAYLSEIIAANLRRPA